MGQTKTKTPSTEGCGVAYVSTIDWLHDGTGSSEPRQTRVLTTSPSAREKLDSRTKARTRPKDSGLAPSEYAHVGHGLCNTPLARRLCSQGQYGAVTLVQCLLLDKTQRRSDRIIKISPPPLLPLPHYCPRLAASTTAATPPAGAAQMETYTSAALTSHALTKPPSAKWATTRPKTETAEWEKIKIRQTKKKTNTSG